MYNCYQWSLCLVLGFAQPCLGQTFDQQASGVVSARNHVVLSSQRAGQLIEQNAIAGQVVEKGAILGRFDCTIDAATMAVSEIEFQQAKIEAQLQGNLAARGAAGIASVQLANQTVALQQARVAQDAAAMETCAITAPFSGTIVDWKVRNFATLQQGAPLVELVDSTQLFVELIVPVQWIDSITLGQTASFTSDYSARKYPAVIDLISPAADPVSQTIRVNAVLEAGQAPPKVGTSGIVDFGQ